MEWWWLLAQDEASRKYPLPCGSLKNEEGSFLSKLRQILPTVSWLLRKMVSWNCCLEFSKLFLSNYNNGFVFALPVVMGHLGAAISSSQQWWLMNVLLNTLLGIVLNEGKELLSLRLLWASFQASCLWDWPFSLLMSGRYQITIKIIISDIY